FDAREIADPAKLRDRIFEEVFISKDQNFGSERIGEPGVDVIMPFGRRQMSARSHNLGKIDGVTVQGAKMMIIGDHHVASVAQKVNYAAIRSEEHTSELQSRGH